MGDGEGQRGGKGGERRREEGEIGRERGGEGREEEGKEEGGRGRVRGEKEEGEREGGAREEGEMGRDRGREGEGGRKGSRGGMGWDGEGLPSQPWHCNGVVNQTASLRGLEQVRDPSAGPEGQTATAENHKAPGWRSPPPPVLGGSPGTPGSPE